MATLVIESIFPASGQQGVPLATTPSITLSGLDYDEDSLTEGMFLEGPDTDQFVGPGLIGLASPQNISQGDVDDFLMSPGYYGIVEGTVTVSGVGGSTVVTFTPTQSMAPLTDYRMNLTAVLAADGETTISGFFTSPFTTGSGSIIAVPSTTSSSILSAVASESDEDTTTTAFAVVSTTPADHSLDNDLELSEIVVEFNKNIDEDTLAGRVTVETVGATDHPNATINSQGELAITTEVDGKYLKIKL